MVGKRSGLAAAGLMSLCLCTAAGAAPQPQPYRSNDAGGFVNILPPGQNGHADASQVIAFSGLDSVFGSGDAARPAHSSDQLDMYEDLVFASPTLPSGRLLDFYKDASFGVAPGQVAQRYAPREDVTILRDRRFGVPHIYGSDRAGAMFGAGYVGAEDRLFLMDVLRHLGRAKLSSFIGGAEGNRQLDRDQWRIAPYREQDLQRQYDLADEVYGDAGRQVQEDVTAYVAGINKYICEAAPGPDCSAAERASTPGSKNGDSPAQKLPGAYAAITPNGESGPAALRPKRWEVTDPIATASLVGGIFGKGGGRELDAAQILEAALDRFGGADGRGVYEDFRSREDPEAPTTAAGSFPYRAPPDSVAPDSDGRPDPGTVRESPVVAAGGPGGRPGGILPSFPFPTGASNALVVSGDESRSGRPVAVFGPQTGYFSPQLLMELDIHAPASRTPDGSRRQAIDARGAAFPGVNLYVQLGRGRDYAWSATSAGQDNVDTFALELCQPGGEPAPEALEDFEGYRYRGRCERFERLERRNSWVPNAADQSAPGSETLQTNRTKLGLELARARIDGEPHVYVQLRSTYFHEADSALGFVDYNDPAKMRTPAGFRAAASKIGFTFNWFYVNGRDIAYFNSGSNPVRKGDSHPDFPVRACPDDGDPCKYEWRGWDPEIGDPRSPNGFVSDHTPPQQHPQAVNPSYLTSWNNKQAPGYRAADDNFSYQSIHRSEPLDDRIRPRIGGSRRMALPELVDAMEDAGTVDLRGDKVLPVVLDVLRSGPGVPADLRDEVALLERWSASGAHRRDRNDDGAYEHAAAIRIMDAWWPRLVEAQFKPALGERLYERLVDMIDLDDPPGPVGSAYLSGWFGYVEKDLRTLLGRRPAGRYSRTYCGAPDEGEQGGLPACRETLASTLREALGAGESELYPGGGCEDEDGSGQSAQYCHDAVEHTAVGAITQPPIHWVNRPTFQQAVEVGAARRPAQRRREPERESAGRVPSPEPRPAAESGGGSLPFTGFAVALVALVGLLALLAGHALRRSLD